MTIIRIQPETPEGITLLLSPCCQAPLYDAMFVTARCGECLNPVSLCDYDEWREDRLVVSGYSRIVGALMAKQPRED